MKRATMVMTAFAGMMAAGTAWVAAQEPTVRAPLQKFEYPPNHESHLMLVTNQPGAMLPRHTHPGVEMSYVVEGELTVSIEGKPDMVVKAGSSFTVPPNVIHSARNTAPTQTKVIAAFVIDKGKPVAMPAP